MTTAVIVIAAFAWLICGGWACFVLCMDEYTKPEYIPTVFGLSLCLAPFAFGVALAVQQDNKRRLA